MIKLGLSLGEFMVRAAALYMAIVFTMRGALLKRRLRHALVDNAR